MRIDTVAERHTSNFLPLGHIALAFVLHSSRSTTIKHPHEVPALVAGEAASFDVLNIRLRCAVLDWLRELAAANGVSVGNYAAFLLESFCLERMDCRAALDLSGFEVAASLCRAAIRLQSTHCVAIAAGDWLKIVDAVIVLTHDRPVSTDSREVFLEATLDRLAHELGGVSY